MNKMIKLINVKKSERNKNGFNNLNGFTPDENKAISSCVSLCLANKETTEIKKDIERVINKTLGSESIYNSKSSPKVICMLAVMFAMEIIIIIDVIKKRIKKIIIKIGQNP